MNKVHSILVTTIVSLFLLGCGNPSNDKLKVQTETVTHEEHQHDDQTDAIELNNGEKWKVNHEMLPPIRIMEKVINDFTIAEQNDYKSLAEKLQKNIDVLTSSCTMTGKAHDELHKWLLPYIAMVDKLNKSKNSDDALHIFEEIKSSYKTFNLYFE